MTATSAGQAPSPVTWAAWAAAATPIVPVVAFSSFDLTGYVREVLALPTSSADGVLTTLPSGYAASFASFAVVSLLGLAASIAFVVLAAVDFRILTRRGIDRPFHWAWALFGLVNSGALLYLIGRTVVGRRRTGRGAGGPLWLWVVLAAVSFVLAGVKVGTAIAEVGPLIAQLTP